MKINLLIILTIMSCSLYGAGEQNDTQSVNPRVLYEISTVICGNMKPLSPEVYERAIEHKRKAPEGSSIQDSKQDTQEQLYKCDLCDYTNATLKGLSKHKVRHPETKQYKCDYCDKSFASSCSLIKHDRIHTDSAFPCEECPKVFLEYERLIIHKRRHTGEKPFSCEQCEKAYTSSEGLKRHKKDKHSE